MSDQSVDNEKQKKFRSPPYPMYDLKKAVERAKALYAKAQQHPVGVNVIAEAWGMKSSDGRVWRAAAALIQYSLLLDSGTGQSRKFWISDSAKRIIVDNDPDSQRRKEALRAAALSPMIHKELWQKFQSTKSLADSVVLNYLMLDRGEAGESPYSQSSAVEVLNTYRASIAYAGLSDSDKVEAPTDVKTDVDAQAGSQSNPVKVKVGDFVKWTMGGIDQFAARKVDWISEDGSHLRVIGSMTGIPMNEVEKVAGPSVFITSPSIDHQVEQVSATTAQSQASIAKTGGNEGKLKSVTTSVVGQRLQISADVSADEIDALKDMLTKYQEILKLMN
ncbi:hypothetical protein NKJ59_20110 [Mesorhizobium australicum]|uniref:hypothetical protein n=1 Tax=Mesorhizobium australicum TaxID=536018 RepID=UPI003338B74D